MHHGDCNSRCLDHAIWYHLSLNYAGMPNLLVTILAVWFISVSVCDDVGARTTTQTCVRLPRVRTVCGFKHTRMQTNLHKIFDGEPIHLIKASS